MGDTTIYSYQELILADRARIRYNRTSPGTGWTDAVYSHTSSTTEYYGSTIVWNGNGWDLKLKNGTTLVFPEAFAQGNPAKAAVKLIRDRYNNTITLPRDSATGNLQRITSPNGRWVSLTYDASGRLWKFTNQAAGVHEFTYL